MGRRAGGQAGGRAGRQAGSVPDFHNFILQTSTGQWQLQVYSGLTVDHWTAASVHLRTSLTVQSKVRATRGSCLQLQFKQKIDFLIEAEDWA